MSRLLFVENLGMVFVPTSVGIADPLVPALTAEINNASSLDMVGVANGEALVTESVTGFSTTPTQIETPDYVSLQVGKIAGSVSVDDASMDFYLDDTTNDIYNGLAVGDTGFIVIIQKFDVSGAITAGDDCEVWPVTVQDKTIKFTGANEAAKWTLSVACGVPTKDAAVTGP